MFSVNTELKPWTASPRRAGVSSFGIGGTNAHVVLEEAPQLPAAPPDRRSQVLPVSARSPAALERATANLAQYLELHPELPLSDIAFTLQLGRRAFSYRRAIVCSSSDQAVKALTAAAPAAQTRREVTEQQQLAFLFPGQGSQFLNMGQKLYESEPLFQKALNRCFSLLLPLLGLNLRQVLFPPATADQAAAAERLQQTALAQPALFAFEYALAQVWIEWGLRPSALLGHSIGEYVAACLAGVFSLEDALWLVVQRGQLMQQLPAGTMLSVSLPEPELSSLLTRFSGRVSIAAVNGPALCVASGPEADMEALLCELRSKDVGVKPLKTSHAFHSPMMEPMVARFSACVERLRRQPPQIPFLSNLTGAWITSEQATSSSYWVRHLREAVRFSDNLEALFARPEFVLLEVGPGEVLTRLATRHPKKPAEKDPVASLPEAERRVLPAPAPADGGSGTLLGALAHLWTLGVEVDWSSLHGDAPRRRVPLPTYPFERQTLFLALPKEGEAAVETTATAAVAAPDTEENVCLSLEVPGCLSRLALTSAPRRAPGRGEVEIAVSAAGLSFKDVLRALDLLPVRGARPSGALRFGLECAGQVVRCGPDVTELAPGDAVLAVGESCCGRFVTLPLGCVAPIPPGIGFAAAATIPMSFLTAYHALHRIARLRASDRVLIHAAAGGVGLAAVQLAQLEGAEVFAGAGTEDKRTYLRSLGLVHVFDSRSLSFADEVLSATASRGVDVLLNVRGDAFISKGLSVLAPYGHFIELGLHNVYSETALHLRELEKGIRFFTLRFSPEVAEFSALLSDVLELFRSGMLQPLPYRCFAAAEAASAFALLQQGEAIGKLVLTFREGERSELLPSGIPAPMRARPRPGLRPPPRPKVQTPSPAAPALPAGQRGGLRSGLLPRPSLATPYRAPQTEIEKKLCAIWQSLLGIDGVGVDDDFVDLGGDSLLGVALLGQVRGQLQATLPAHQLLETPTIAALARVIEQQSSDPAKESAADPVLVMLRAAAAQKGQAAPAALFLLHPIDGNVHIYRQLAQTLGPEQPVYALKPPEKEGGAEPLRSVPEMAARYLRAIRKVQPQGPYALGGASFGGMLAYELSQQLFEQGQQVRFVALFDTPGPGDLPALFKEDAEIFAYLNHLGGHFPESAEAREAFLRVWKTNSRAMWEYSPRPPAKRAPLPPFRVLYFRAQQRDVVNSPTPERYWVNLLKTSAPEPSSFELHDVPGNHITMNHAPHVKVIAEILRRYLF